MSEKPCGAYFFAFFEKFVAPILTSGGLAAVTSSFFAALYSAFGKYDVVHIHAEGPAFFSWLPKMFGKRVVVTIHGIDWQREKWQSGLGSKFIHQGEKNAVKYADEVIVLSKGVQDYFKETYGRKTHFIPNGVNRPQTREASLITDKFGLKKDSYILFLGRLVPEKGIRYLVEAFKNVKTDKKLVIAGGSSDTDSFMKELKELAKGDDRILFTGFVQGAMLDELYSNAYIYTLPSDLEGILIFTTRTRLRLVVDLQENVKAQENLAYALKVKISNLQKMAETLVWVQENNINDLAELNDLCKTAQANAQAAYERLSQAEDELYKTNEQIHYAGQYLSTKDVQQQFTKAIFKKKFRAEHSKELDAYAESVKYFREENDGKLPSLKSLKKRKEELIKEIVEKKKAYAPLKEESRRLEIASDNVYSIFRKTNEMKSDLAWKREWEAKVREKARQEQRARQPKRKKRSYDMSL